jgi:probable phosphoglycerate mutase
MSLNLYLLRHGETTYSRSGGFCGNLDPELTTEGAQMAEEFAEAYRSVPWAAVFASPMRRTVATARPLCEALGIEPRLRDGLKEIAYGDWEGRTTDEVKKSLPDDYHNWMTEPAWNAPTGDGETALQVANRASVVVTEILETVAEGNVLIVSHKATLRILLCSFLGIDLGRYRDRINALAGSVSRVHIGEYGPLLETLGDRSYMSESLRSLPGT